MKRRPKTIRAVLEWAVLNARMPDVHSGSYIMNVGARYICDAVLSQLPKMYQVELAEWTRELE